MSKLQDILSKAAAALQGTPDADSMRETLREITGRIDAVDRRQKEIGHDGPERQRVLESGTPAEMVALDKELAELRAEEQQLRHRSAELHKRRERALAAEGIQGAAQARKALAEAVAKATKAQAAYHAAVAEAKDKAEAIRGAKLACRRVKDTEGEAKIYADNDTTAALVAMLHPGDLQAQAEAARDLAPAVTRAKLKEQVNSRIGRMPQKAGAAPLF